MSVPRPATGPIELLLVDDAPEAEEAVRAAVHGRYLSVSQVRDLNAAAALMDRQAVDILLLAVSPTMAPAPPGLWVSLPVLAIIDVDDQDAELLAMEYGALDWVTREELRAEHLPRAIRYVLDRHRLETELRRMAHVDPLTGLHNRRYLMKELDAAVGAARRHGHALTVSVCDLDHFKRVNDEYGHLAGDDVLRAFAGIVSRQLRREDAVARFGGDEFCLMFPHVGAAEAARAIERIRATLQQQPVVMPDGGEVSVTATYGVAEYNPERHPSGQAVFEAADRALYEGKLSGRNQLWTAPD